MLSVPSSHSSRADRAARAPHTAPQWLPFSLLLPLHLPLPLPLAFAPPVSHAACSGRWPGALNPFNTRFNDMRILHACIHRHAHLNPAVKRHATLDVIYVAADHNLLNTDRLCTGQTMHQTVWLLGGAGLTRESRSNRFSNCLVTICSTRTGSALVKLCTKQFGYWVELVVPGSAGQTVCQTVWSQSAQHGQALHRSNYAHQTVWLLGGADRTRECRPNRLSNCLVTIFSTRTGSAQVKLCIKQFGSWVELVVPGSAGQIVGQTVWSQSSQHGQALLRSNYASNSLVTAWTSWSYH